MVTQDFTAQTKELIDNLKGVCTSYGLGNDGNEFKIITQVFIMPPKTGQSQASK